MRAREFIELARGDERLARILEVVRERGKIRSGELLRIVRPHMSQDTFYGKVREAEEEGLLVRERTGRACWIMEPDSAHRALSALREAVGAVRTEEDAYFLGRLELLVKGSFAGEDVRRLLIHTMPPDRREGLIDWMVGKGLVGVSAPTSTEFGAVSAFGGLKEFGLEPRIFLGLHRQLSEGRLRGKTPCKR